MRKGFSIAFVILVLFNALGYYGLFLGLDYKNNQEISELIDSENYDRSETITIKVPLSMPYGGPTTSRYERVSGKFEYNGEFYQLVKQRFSNDTLYIVCLNDNMSKRIESAFGSYAKTLSDKPSEAGQTAKLFSLPIKDYIVKTFSIQSSSSGWARSVVNNPSRKNFISEFQSSIVHPPERIV